MEIFVDLRIICMTRREVHCGAWVEGLGWNQSPHFRRPFSIVSSNRSSGSYAATAPRPLHQVQPGGRTSSQGLRPKGKRSWFALFFAIDTPQFSRRPRRMDHSVGDQTFRPTSAARPISTARSGPTTGSRARWSWVRRSGSRIPTTRCSTTTHCVRLRLGGVGRPRDRCLLFCCVTVKSLISRIALGNVRARRGRGKGFGSVVCIDHAHPWIGSKPDGARRQISSPSQMTAFRYYARKMERLVSGPQASSYSAFPPPGPGRMAVEYR